MIANDDSVYRFLDNEGHERSFEVQGHRLLVRKCQKPDQTYLLNDGVPTHEPKNPAFAPEVDAILATMTDDTRQNVCEVLAIGRDCGTPRPKADRKRLGIKNIVFEGKRGDFVILPEFDERMHRGVLDKWQSDKNKGYDFTVDEATVVAVIPND